ncbi:MAG: anti-sigma factor [Pseudomonadota bacterium]
MNENSKLSEKDSWLAAEFALGVLEREQMADADARADRDPAFRAAVEGWNGQLSPILEDVEDVKPPADVWKQIENRIAPSPIEPEVTSDGVGFWKLISAFTSTVAVACFGLMMYVTGGDFTGSEVAKVKQEFAQAQDQIDAKTGELQAAQTQAEQLASQLEASQNTLIAQQNETSAAEEQVATLEQELTSANTLVADLQEQLSSGRLALQTVQQELEATQEALDNANTRFAQIDQQVREARPLVASLTQSGDAPAFVAQYDPIRRALLIRTEINDTDEKVPEVWLIPAQGERKGDVLSLGVMNEAAPDQLPISDDFVSLIGEGGTLAITMEPPGGAPNGVATGPVIALGQLQAF